MRRKWFGVILVGALVLGGGAELQAARKGGAGGAGRSLLMTQMKALGYGFGVQSKQAASVAAQLGPTTSLSAYARQYRSASAGVKTGRVNGGEKRGGMAGLPQGMMTGLSGGGLSIGDAALGNGLSGPVPGGYGPNLNSMTPSVGTAPALAQYGYVLDASSDMTSLDLLSALGISADQVAALQRSGLTPEQLMALAASTGKGAASISPQQPSGAGIGAAPLSKTGASSRSSAFAVAFSQASTKGPVPGSYGALTATASVGVSQYGDLAGASKLTNYQYGGISGDFKGSSSGSPFSQGTSGMTQTLTGTGGTPTESSPVTKGSSGGSFWGQSALAQPSGSQPSGMSGMPSPLGGTMGQ